jgi:tetratricopeptide (TPR) repeat protein
MAPFSLLTYADALGRAALIARVVTDRTMPPWLPEPGHGRFAGERRLGDNEIDLIRRWADSGAREGPRDDLPPAPTWPQGWQLGEPDLIVSTLGYDVPAGGTDLYRNFVIPLDVGSRRFVRAVEFRPDHPHVVHHARILIDRSEVSRQLDERDPAPGYDGMLVDAAEFPDGHFLGWAPGRLASSPPDDLAWRLDPGTDLVVQVHLRPTGQPERIQARVGLFFARSEPTRRGFVLRLQSKTIDIPPGETDHVVEDRYVLPVDIEVLRVYPHAHYLGKDLKGFATLPDGTRKWLIWIRSWDFEWQDEYAYAEPVSLPRGTTVTMRYTYDNSGSNARNPNRPPQRVVFGPRSTDEMAELALQVLPASAEDLAVLKGDAARRQLAVDMAGDEQRLRSEPDNAAVHRSLAGSYLRLGRGADATRHAETALRIGGREASTLNALGNALAAEGRFDEAILRYEESLALSESAETLNNLGVALQARGRVEEAVARYRRALERRPMHPFAHNNLANVLKATGRTDLAIEHYRQALDVRPDSAEVQNNLGTALQAAGRFDEAAEQFRRALRLDPEYAEAHNNLAIELARSGRVAEAITHYRDALRLRGDYPEARNNLGDALRNQGRLGEAVDEFRLAIAARPGYGLAHRNLGDALQALGRIEEAAAAHERALELRPDDPDAHAGLAIDLHLLGRTEEAIARYRQALAIKPNAAEVQFNLGNALVTAKRIDEAVEAFRAAAALEPRHQAALRNLGVVLEMTGRHDEAADQFRAALRLDPSCSTSLSGLAGILATHPDPAARRPAEAIELARRAADVTRYTDADVLIVLAQAYAAGERFVEAAATARRARDLARRDRPDLMPRIETLLEQYGRIRREVR